MGGQEASLTNLPGTHSSDAAPAPIIGRHSAISSLRNTALTQLTPPPHESQGTHDDSHTRGSGSRGVLSVKAGLVIPPDLSASRGVGLLEGLPDQPTPHGPLPPQTLSTLRWLGITWVSGWRWFYQCCTRESGSRIARLLDPPTLSVLGQYVGHDSRWVTAAEGAHQLFSRRRTPAHSTTAQAPPTRLTPPRSRTAASTPPGRVTAQGVPPTVRGLTGPTTLSVR